MESNKVTSSAPNPCECLHNMFARYNTRGNERIFVLAINEIEDILHKSLSENGGHVNLEAEFLHAYRHFKTEQKNRDTVIKILCNRLGKQYSFYAKLGKQKFKAAIASLAKTLATGIQNPNQAEKLHIAGLSEQVLQHMEVS